MDPAPTPLSPPQNQMSERNKDICVGLCVAFFVIGIVLLVYAWDRPNVEWYFILSIFGSFILSGGFGAVGMKGRTTST